ncbi:MAG: adenylate cyclase [Alphaproteobacteria bacterium]|jgi:adenylate cyclase
MTFFVIVTALMTLYAVFITAVWWLQKQNADEQQKNNEALTLSLNNDYMNSLGVTSAQEASATRAMLAKADEAKQLHQTFQKFVPRQFVEHFAKGGIDSLTLGYADEDDVAIMFCDIRGFTRLSEEMSPQQLMNFLNAYFMRMNAPIHDNFGFIDKFIGDAIMALFDHPNGQISDKAADSVRAALDLQKALKLYNHHRAKSGYGGVKNGIGLHVGPVVVGTVGSDDRMDTTVIGHTVNVAQRIESLTNYFGVEILASKELVCAAGEEMEFASRTLDKVVLKGKSTSIEIIEIYEHLSEERINARNASKNLMSEAISMRNTGDFKGALNLFLRAQENDPGDTTLVHHITTCEKLEHEEDWDGKIRIS